MKKHIFPAIVLMLILLFAGCKKEHVHQWKAATCTSPKLCTLCGEESGNASGHAWIEASCTHPKHCNFCGVTVGTSVGHQWIKASCTQAKHCTTCGLAEGTSLGHQWIEATYETPKTCNQCGTTEGSPKELEPVYLVDVSYKRKFGKIWYRSDEEISYRAHTNKDAPGCWKDMNTPGHTSGPVKDNRGNLYTYGIHVDGSHDEPKKYHIAFDISDLGEEYTTFRGTVAYPENVINTKYSPWYDKSFQIFGNDSKLLYESPVMNKDSDPETFSFSIEGYDTLTIIYPATSGPNEVATLFDGRFTD